MKFTGSTFLVLMFVISYKVGNLSPMKGSMHKKTNHDWKPMQVYWRSYPKCFSVFQFRCPGLVLFQCLLIPRIYVFDRLVCPRLRSIQIAFDRRAQPLRRIPQACEWRRWSKEPGRRRTQFPGPQQFASLPVWRALANTQIRRSWHVVACKVGSYCVQQGLPYRRQSLESRKMIGISSGDQNVLIVFTKKLKLLWCNLSAVRRYLGGAGPSEEEVLGLALLYTSPSQKLNPPPPHPRSIWHLSINSIYIWPWGLKYISGSLRAIIITHSICVNVNGFSSIWIPPSSVETLY